MSRATGAQPYEIVVEGVLDDQWAQWLGGACLTHVDGRTIIGLVVDDAGLHAVLARVRDLGLRLESVRRVG